MSEPSWTPDEVAEQYDATSHMSEMFNDGQEHLGYWYHDSDDTSVTEAARRLTRKIVDGLGLRPGEHLLDAGCGTGSTGVQIAQEYGARVTGITISPVEVAKAQERAVASGLSEQVGFEVGDFHSLSFPEDHFDAVLGIESVMHAIDLQKVLLELHRVLRPGGRLVIAEMTKVSAAAKVPISKAREPMLAQEWRTEVADAGFVVEEWTECGRRVFGRSGPRFLARTEELRAELVAAFGAEFVDAIKNAQEEAFAPGAENMGYLILSASKPAA